MLSGSACQRRPRASACIEKRRDPLQITYRTRAKLDRKKSWEWGDLWPSLGVILTATARTCRLTDGEVRLAPVKIFVKMTDQTLSLRGLKSRRRTTAERRLMTTTPMNRFIQHLLATCGRDGMTDGELLTRFL